MVFDYTVKVNGIKYLAGIDVPIDENGNLIENKPIEKKPIEKQPEMKPLEQAKEVFEKKADETVKKNRGGRKPKQ